MCVDESVSTQRLVRIFAELNETEAWALAQFLKRAGFTDYRRLAQNDSEADAMCDRCRVYPRRTH